VRKSLPHPDFFNVMSQLICKNLIMDDEAGVMSGTDNQV
jgi:hypothetical protein